MRRPLVPTGREFAGLIHFETHPCSIAKHFVPIRPATFSPTTPYSIAFQPLTLRYELLAHPLLSFHS
jgi:hypothetical protein